MPSKNAKKKSNQNMQKGANAFPPKKIVNTAADSSSDDDDDSSEELMKMPVTAGASGPAKFQKTMESDSDEELDSEDLDESDDEINQGHGAADVGDSDDDDDDDDDDDSSDEAGVSAAASNMEASAMGMAKAGKTAAGMEDDDDEDDDDDDDDDDDQEEEEDEDKEEDENGSEMEDDEDEAEEYDDDDDDEDDDDDDDDDESAPGNKRKLPTAAASAPAKKPKTDTSSAGQELFVHGFPQGVVDEKIVKFFAKNGVKVAPQIRRVKGKQFCFVDVLNASDVDKAVQLSGQEFKGNTLKVEVSQKKSQPGAAQQKTDKAGKAGKKGKDDKAEENKKNVFVKNIAWAIAEDELKELFSGCKNVRMPKRPDGSSRGFAFVEFNTEEQAAAAIEEHNEEEVQGRELQVSYASIGGKSTPQTPERAPTTESKTLIIRNLSFDTSEDGLSDAFDSAVKCRLMTHADSGKSKGFAFIEFESIDDAKKAVKSMNDQTLDGRPIRVDFAHEKGSGDGYRGRGGGGGGFRGGRGGGFRGRGGGDGGGHFRGGRGGGRGNFRGGRGGRGGRGRGGFKSRD